MLCLPYGLSNSEIRTLYRAFHNSRPREKGHLPTTISCQKIETKNLLLLS
jgi:hypothetical protein